MLDLARADAESEAGECAMGAGMRVAANHRHARQRSALLRADHVNDALTPVEEREVDLRAEFACSVSVSTCRRETGS